MADNGTLLFGKKINHRAPRERIKMKPCELGGEIVFGGRNLPILEEKAVTRGILSPVGSAKKWLLIIDYLYKYV